MLKEEAFSNDLMSLERMKQVDVCQLGGANAEKRGELMLTHAGALPMSKWHSVRHLLL